MFDVLQSNDQITTYLDGLIKKALEKYAVFAQFARFTSLGSAGPEQPADWQYDRLERTEKGFEIEMSEPGTRTRFGQDTYQVTTGSVDLYAGGLELPYELKKVQRWPIQESILEDMAVEASIFFEKAMGTYLVTNAGVTAEGTPDSLTFPGDLILGRKTVRDALNRNADAILIASNLYDTFLADDNFILVDQYGGREVLFNGEVGTIYGMRIVETQYLDLDGISTGVPTKDTVIFLRSDRPTLRVMHWSPLWKFDSWWKPETRVFQHDLHGYYDMYIWDDNALTQMQI